jgi:hypothetical protein
MDRDQRTEVETAGDPRLPSRSDHTRLVHGDPGLTVCGVAGKFMVHGHPGVNRVRFNGKVQGRQLAPGTYRINARTRGSARVLHVTLVVVGAGIPSSSELLAARRRNVCGGTLGARATRTSGGFTAVSRSLHGPAKSSIVRHQNPSGTGPHGHRSSAAPFSPARV